MSRHAPTTASPAIADLRRHAERAANGDEDAFDRVLAAIGTSAWGVAFAGADAVAAAVDAMGAGIAETLHVFDSGLPVDDVEVELLRSVRAAALEIASSTGAHTADIDLREPVSLLNESADRQATLAFTALPEPMRSAIWLVEVVRMPSGRAAAVLGEPEATVDASIKKARQSFRRYYLDAIPRAGRSEACIENLPRLAPYIGRVLPAGEMAAVERHLSTCDTCRSLARKLDDLEAPVRDALPSLPVWTRQRIADIWAQLAPPPEDRPGPAWWLGKRRPIVAIGSTAVVLLAAVGVVLATGGISPNGSSDAAQSSPATAMTKAAASGSTTSSTAADGTTTTVGTPETTVTTTAPSTTSTSSAAEPPAATSPTTVGQGRKRTITTITVIERQYIVVPAPTTAPPPASGTTSAGGPVTTPPTTTATTPPSYRLEEVPASGLTTPPAG